MRHNTEIPYAQQEEHYPVKLFRFENEHINKNKFKKRDLKSPLKRVLPSDSSNNCLLVLKPALLIHKVGIYKFFRGLIQIDHAFN
jgi:hypothetical protein